MELISFNKLKESSDFSSLASSLVYDNAEGNASGRANKTSVWIVSKDKTIRVVNISTTMIDNIDDFGLIDDGIAVLAQALCEVTPKETEMHMNPFALWQLSLSKLIQIKNGDYYFMDAKCCINSSIKTNEQTVV